MFAVFCINVGAIGLADIALKFIPGFGSMISAGAGAIATQGLGDAAIAYFLKNEANLN